MLSVLAAVALVGLANAAPLAGPLLFGRRFAWPLDGGTRFVDGRPLLGHTKTMRGLLLAMVVTALAAPLLGYAAATGLQVAVFAMLGDLLSSFTKRRFGFKPSSQAVGLDQIPESLLPLLACRAQLGLGTSEIVVAVVIFAVVELLLSRALFHLRLRDRPY